MIRQSSVSVAQERGISRLAEVSSPPGISIVTPCLNQARWLGAATSSVLGQEYPTLQYVIMDGGSTDGSAEIAKNLSERLHHLETGKDGSQYEAINRGFALTDAPIMGWLNGDDLYFPWTLSLVGEIFSKFPEIRWLTTCHPIVLDEDGRPRDCRETRGYSRQGILHGETLPGSDGFILGGIQQESTFWRRDLWEEAGGLLETEFDYAADFDLWMRFARRADVYSVPVPLAAFRRHGDQKTSNDMERYRRQAMESFQRHGESFSNRLIRGFARQVLPERLKPVAARAGFLYPAKIVKKLKNTGEWVIQDILG